MVFICGIIKLKLVLNLNLNLNFSSGKVDHNFPCPGQGLVCSFNDLQCSWQMTCQSLAHRASENEMLLAQKENLLIPDTWTALFSSPDMCTKFLVRSNFEVTRIPFRTCLSSLFCKNIEDLLLQVTFVSWKQCQPAEPTSTVCIQ